MHARAREDTELLRRHFPNLEYQELDGTHWFLLPTYPVPPGWSLQNEPVTHTPVCFSIGPAFPVGEPYAFQVARALRYQGSAPANASEAANSPFPGEWTQLSWSPDGWAPVADVQHGSNLTDWARSFGRRLEAGV